MPYAVFAIRVKDYSTWRKTYDARRSTRASAGIEAARVYQDIENPNSVTVMLDGELDRLRAYATSVDVNTSYGPAGVIGQPVVTFANEVT